MSKKVTKKVIKKVLAPAPEFKKPIYKFSVESKNLEIGDLSFNEPNLVISLIGEKTDIRSGIIKGMIADDTLAEIILDAADYYLSNKK